MSDYLALLRSVVEAPEDDLPRLVLADWLEEHGQPQRAEFIRVQCRLADLPGDWAGYAELLDRERELGVWLLARDPDPQPAWPDGFHSAQDAGVLPTRLTGQHPRGFPLRFSYGRWGKWASPPAAIAHDLAGVLATTTRRHFCLDLHRHNLDTARGLLRRPELGGLAGLELHAGASGKPQLTRAQSDDLLLTLAGCPHLGSLRDLALRLPLGDDGLAALAGARHLDNLRSLRLECGPVSSAGLLLLARPGWFHQLRSLRVGVHYAHPHDGPWDELLDALGWLGPFPRLAALDVACQRFSPDALRRFLGSTAFPALRSLDLSFCRADGWVDALRECELALRELNLSHVGQGRALVDALIASPVADTLAVLDLQANGLTDAEAATLARSPRLANLRHLLLAQNSLDGAGWLALAQSGPLSGLTRMSLDGPGHRLTEGDAVAFMDALRMTGLRSLDLGGRRVGDGGAAALAGSAWAASLRELRLSRCHIGGDGLAALLRSSHLDRLQKLSLSRNEIRGQAGALLDPAVLPALVECDLSDNPLPVEEAERLRARRGVRV